MCSVLKCLLSVCKYSKKKTKNYFFVTGYLAVIAIGISCVLSSARCACVLGMATSDFIFIIQFKPYLQCVGPANVTFYSENK